MREEVGDKGTPHLQGYVGFLMLRPCNRCVKFVPRAHLEVAKGNDAQNRLYCSKSGTNVFEIGVVGEQGKRSDLATISKILRIRRFRLKTSCGLIQSSMRGVTEHSKDMFNAVMTARTEAPEVTWLLGAAGVGKTRWLMNNLVRRTYIAKITPLGGTATVSSNDYD